MTYLLAQLLPYLVLAFLIGLVIGWWSSKRSIKP